MAKEVLNVIGTLFKTLKQICMRVTYSTVKNMGRKIQQ